MLTAIRIPVPPTGHGYAYEKLKRKIGDYATAAAAVGDPHHDGGKVTSCAIGLTNVGDTPLFAKDAAGILTGSSLDDATVQQGGGGGRGDHFARRRRPRPGGLPHQDGRRHAPPRARPRQVARQG